MKRRRIMVTWLGNSDLLAMARDSRDSALIRFAAEQTNRDARKARGEGHVLPLVSLHFDEIHVLSMWDITVPKVYLDRLEGLGRIHVCKPKDPYSFPEVFLITKGLLEQIVQKDDDLYLNLSPGTPAMISSLLLLGKTYFPARFYQNHPRKGVLRQEEMPFDIVMDCITDRIRLPDIKLQTYESITRRESVGFQDVIGTSQVIKALRAKALLIAARDVDVLIQGESGTGKESFARGIHQESHRGKAGKPIVALNCAAIPEALLESELFGVMKGAFTGAVQRDGAFKRADGGTLFLDEIGDLNLSHQAKLLRALQPQRAIGPCIRTIQPVGMTKPKDEFQVDVRVIAATNRNLLERIRQETFRDDLYYRFAVFLLNLPPLRDRRKDIESIASHLLDRINDDFQKSEPAYKRKSLSRDAIVALCKRSWLGNIRELEAVLMQISVFMDGEKITAEAIDYLAPELVSPSSKSNLLQRGPGEVIDLKQRMNEIEMLFIEEAMRETNESQTQAEKLLGINQRTISKKLKNAASLAKRDRKR